MCPHKAHRAGPRAALEGLCPDAPGAGPPQEGLPAAAGGEAVQQVHGGNMLIKIYIQF